MKKISKGFSLIELLVVIGIVAILAALATFNFNTARIRARDAQRKSDLRTVRDAIELYKTDNNYNVPTSADFATLLTDLGDFINGSVSDPKVQMNQASWEEYTYTPSGDTYTLTACLENTADEDALSTLCPDSVSGPGRKYEINP